MWNRTEVCFRVLIVSFLLGSVNLQNSQPFRPTDNKSLVESLLKRCDKLLKPPGNVNGTVRVTFDLEIFRIVHLDEEKQVLTLDARLHISWKDDRLRWLPNPSKIKSAVLPVDKLWTPDLHLTNTAGVGDGLIYPVDSIIVYDGSVFYVKPVRLSSYCQVSDQFQVNCTLVFISWMYDANSLDLNLLPGHDTANLYQFEDFNREWSLAATTVKRNTIQYECCPEVYLDLTYMLTLQRK